MLVAACFSVSVVLAGDDDVADGSVSAAIREAGFPCKHVTQLERSTQGAEEGITEWYATCNSGKFKVSFKGDTGAEVVPLD